MRPIPLKIRERLSKDKAMERCLVYNCGRTPVQWHHPLIYSGKQVNKWYSIAPLCEKCHMGNFGSITPVAKCLSELWCIKRGWEEIHTDLPKFNWKQRKIFLENKLKSLWNGTY